MQRLTRRGLLSGGAAAALGLPFLANFAHGGTGAQTRLVIVWTPNDAQWVDQYETPLTPGQALPASLPTFLQPFEAFRDRLAVVGGIENPFEGGHTSIGHSLTAVDWIGPDGNNFWAGGVSVDQHIAQALGVEALTMGVSCGSKNGKGRMSYSASQTPVDPIEDPRTAFDALFADVGAEPAELAARRARKHSVLDRVVSDLESYRQQIPAEQRPRLEQHLDGVRAIEAKIDDELLGSCDPSAPGALDISDNALIPEVMRAELSIIAQALGCGATRVATLQLGRAGGGFTPLWPGEGLDLDLGLDVHGIAHEHYLQPDNQAILADSKAVEAWYSAQVAYLLEQLDAIPDPEGGGTLLDSTLVVHVKELGRRHGTDPMTYVMAGGPNLITGDRFFSFDRPHADLLLTLCHKMGVMDASFGAGSTGPLLL